MAFVHMSISIGRGMEGDTDSCGPFCQCHAGNMDGACIWRPHCILLALVASHRRRPAADLVELSAAASVTVGVDINQPSRVPQFEAVCASARDAFSR